MGTSASYGTPAGGEWRNVKRQITAIVSGRNTSATPASIVGGTASASGGLSFGGGGNGRKADGGGGRGRIADVVAGVGGFGGAIRDDGFDVALVGLGLAELRGRSAAEVAAAVSEHLARDADGLDAEFLQSALMDAMLEAASLGDESGYEDFAQGMEAFIAAQGPEGLVELFLGHFVFETLWARIEQHAVDRCADDAAVESLMAAIKGECDAQVSEEMQAARDAATFDHVDWFGRGGRDVGMRVVEELESRLAALRDT